MIEKRLHPRLEFPLQVDLTVAGEQRLATLENLSAGGAALRFPEFLNPGSLIERLRFDLPNGAHGRSEEIVAVAKVVRAEPIQQAEGEGGFQLGVSFENLPEDSFRRIQQFIYQRLTKGSPQFDEMPLERRRIAIEQQVAVTFDRFDEFVSEVAENISMSGMFLRTPDPKPPGTEFSFQFRLGDDFALIEGRAEVVWTRRKSLGPGKAAGMGVRFLQLDDASRRTIRKLVEEASASQRLDKPSSGKVRVAAVIPKAPSKPRAAAKKAAAPPAAAAPRPAGDVEKLRRELGRRTRAYEEKIERLSLKIVELAANREERAGAATGATGAAPETQQALVEEKGQLEQQCQQLEHERRDLQAQLTEVNEQLAAQREETETALSEIAAERRSRAGLDNRLRAVEQALRHSETERDRSQQRLKEVTKARDELAARLEEGGLVDASEHDKLSRRLAEESTERARLAEQVARVARERSDLEQRLEAAVAKAAALQEREEEHRDLASRLATLEAEHSNLEILLSGATTDRAELEREVARLREQDRARRQEEAAEESERQELQQALERARSEVEEAHADGMRLAGELRGQLEALKAEERSLVDQVTALEEERDELERELAARREAEKTTRRNFESLETELEEVRGELAATAANRERRVGTLEWVLAEARSEKRDLEDRLAALEQGRAELEERFEERGETVATQLANLEAAERERQQTEEVLYSIRSEAEAQRERAEELARQLDEATARLETIEREAHGRAEELTRELEETAARLEKREGEARERIEELTRELEERDKVVAAAGEQMEALEGRLRASEEASEELREEASRLEVEAEELRRQRQILETQARSAEEDMGGELAAVRQQLKELTGESAEFEQTAEARRRQIEALEDQLVGERARAAELVVKAEEAEISRRRLEEENVTLQNAVRAVTAAAGVEGVPVPMLETKTERRGGASLRRAAGIAGGGILLAALLWGGLKVVPWPGASSPEVSAPALVGGEGPAAQDGEAPELVVAAEAAATRPAVTAVGGEDAVESGEEAVQPRMLATPPPAPRPAPEETVGAWAEAWSGQRVEDYLAAYSRDFVPPNNLSRAEWEAFRRERLESPPWIRVTLGQIVQEQLTDDRMQVVFTQDYAAGAYSDRVEKTLVLVWEEGAWKILEERSVVL